MRYKIVTRELPGRTIQERKGDEQHDHTDI